jgi:restriction system protein
MLTSFSPREFDERPWQQTAPELATYLPQPPGFFGRLVPGADGRHQRAVERGTQRHGADHEAYLANRVDRARALEEFQETEQKRKADTDRKNDKVMSFKRELAANEHSAVLKYFKLVLDASLKGEPDALSAEIGYSPDSKHLVVDLELPEFSVVPEEIGFKYVKSADRIDPVARPLAKRKACYSNLISQIALKCVDAVFRGDTAGVVACLTLNGMLETIDPATGQEVRVCLLSVRVDADTFRNLNLSQVQPEHCLRSLKASVSRAPTELMAVKPIIELDMVDPRFVETMDVLSGLDHRPNLMDLSPTEFEGLITNLFAKMGLDTRQTRPSRDGGVDCVAFDPRPVFGGKVVIQAKRYKNTVGVSAVRDLFGTVQNEGASKGILVTTSGYGKAAFEFARGKPLELLDGGNLLHLLSEHAGTDARIVMPEGWMDLPIHGE